MIELSIIICTYNRSELLRYCLDSLLNQTVSQEKFEVIVVDNNSTDNTFLVAKKYESKFLHFNYTIEKKVGLSYARNTGYVNAHSNWIAYIDDDAKAAENYVKEALNTIKEYNFDVIGGKYLAWYLYGQKKWIGKQFGVFQDILPTIGYAKTGYVPGGNMIIKKKALTKIGGFDINLGMKGNAIGYGEETFFQDKIRELGYKIGYNPNLIVYHLVGKHKLRLSWHLQSAYAYGRDNYKMWKQGSSNKTYVFKTILKSVARLTKLLWMSAIKKNYYWQNAYLDFLKPIYQALGEYSEYKKSK